MLITNKNKKTKIFIFLIIIFLILFTILIIKDSFLAKPKLKILKINQTTILAEIADTPIKKFKGLSNRDFLPENQGMLFIFEKPDYYSFWMKEMLFPLDFIWIRNGQIVEMTENIKPEDYQPPKFLTPKEKVDLVLEVNAGFIEKFKIKVGDEISF